jgi:hypothetical protein
MDKKTYKKSVKNQIRKGKTGLCCCVCGEDYSEVIEFYDSDVIASHHVDGKNNSDYKIPLCKNCHTKITLEQNSLSPADRSSNASSLKKRAFNLITHGALLKVMGEQQIRIGNELVEYE